MSEQRKRAGLTEMALLAGEEARRIRVVQAGLVRHGSLAQPHAGQIRRAEVFEDMERIFFAMQAVRSEVQRILAPVLRAMATAEKFEGTEAARGAPAGDDENSRSEG